MNNARRDVLRFPAERTSHPARAGATVLDVAKGRFREILGQIANRFGAPGAVRAVKIEDRASGQQITVEVGTVMVRWTVNGRDFYFDRLTGRYDGAGSSTT